MAVLVVVLAVVLGVILWVLMVLVRLGRCDGTLWGR